jgi:hypothetical protein
MEVSYSHLAVKEEGSLWRQDCVVLIWKGTLSQLNLFIPTVRDCPLSTAKETILQVTYHILIFPLDCSYWSKQGSSLFPCLVEFSVIVAIKRCMSSTKHINCEHRCRMFSWNVDICPQGYTTQTDHNLNSLVTSKKWVALYELIHLAHKLKMIFQSSLNSMEIHDRMKVTR